MRIIKTPLNDLYILEPKVFEDTRGYFFESFNSERLSELRVDAAFLQDNESFSNFGTIRGLHYQLAPYAQAKLVRVVMGSILDVAIDIRKGSPTFGQHFSIELNDKSKQMLFIPRGFAHGFSVLSTTATIIYKCDAFYNSEAERGIRYNDTQLAIDWKIKESEAKVSAKDNVLPLFDSIETNFVYGGNF
ncbi:MAG: dTDP-4-dehydrorhamnose 3,5-epimerase [Bacteroidetes bacterium HGW-Bacteroidetes-15]|nr:MAG: dTDP-4-dehydrorhamnose 3,5-epimerase [Bacteroidetes bacterium HGW-Bacteroidetes-15]